MTYGTSADSDIWYLLNALWRYLGRIKRQLFGILNLGHCDLFGI